MNTEASNHINNETNNSIPPMNKHQTSNSPIDNFPDLISLSNPDGNDDSMNDNKGNRHQTDTRLIKKRKKLTDDEADTSLTIKITSQEKNDFLDACAETNQVPSKVLRDLVVKYADVINKNK